MSGLQQHGYCGSSCAPLNGSENAAWTSCHLVWSHGLPHCTVSPQHIRCYAVCSLRPLANKQSRPSGTSPGKKDSSMSSARLLRGRRAASHLAWSELSRLDGALSRCFILYQSGESRTSRYRLHLPWLRRVAGRNPPHSQCRSRLGEVDISQQQTTITTPTPNACSLTSPPESRLGHQAVRQALVASACTSSKSRPFFYQSRWYLGVSRGWDSPDFRTIASLG